MKHLESELVDRYLYDVVKRLPENQRKDIEEELRTVIEDMLEERAEDGKSFDETIKDILGELGNPAELAAKYRGTEQHLIGGEYYPLYCQILKIVLICVAAGMAVSGVISAFVHVDAQSVQGFIYSIQDDIINFVAIPSALMQAFAIVTLIFFIMERNQVKFKDGKTNWSLKDLPQIPAKKATISKADCIVGIVFGVLVSVMFICAPELMGAWLTKSNGEVVAISIFNLAIWDKVLPWFLLCFFIGIIDDLTKLVVGYYSIGVMWVTIVLSSLGAILSVYIFKSYDLWNINFVKEVQNVTGRVFNGKGDIMVYWDGLKSGQFVVQDGLLMIIIMAYVIEVAVTVYRTMRYGNKRDGMLY